MSPSPENMDKNDVGGIWQGDKKRKKRGRFEKEAPPRDKSSRKVLLLLVGLMIVALAVFLAGFVLLSAFLAAALGEGWLLFVMTILLVICIPLAIAFWAVRPMAGKQAVTWWTGVFAAPYLIATIGLIFGVPGRTATMLRYHGAWLPRLLFGAGDSKTRAVDKNLRKIAVLLDKRQVEKREEKDEKPEDEKPSAEEHIGPHKVVFQGKELNSPRPFVIEKGRRKGNRVEVSLKGGVSIVRGRAGKGQGKPVTLALDPRAVRTVLSPEAAARLDLPILKDTPLEEVELHDGVGRYPVLLTDVLSLGATMVNDLAVVVCGPCVHEGLSGLVGINFLKHFEVSIDEESGILHFQKQKDRVNRMLDVEPFVHFAEMQGKWDSGVVKIQGGVGNRGDRRIRRMVIQALLIGEGNKVLGRLSKEIKNLRPGDPEPVFLQGPVDGSVAHFKLKVSEAYW